MSHHNTKLAQEHDFIKRWNLKNNYDCYKNNENISIRAKKSGKEFSKKVKSQK